jgi:hypothetical protein
MVMNFWQIRIWKEGDCGLFQRLGRLRKILKTSARLAGPLTDTLTGCVSIHVTTVHIIVLQSSQQALCITFGILKIQNRVADFV